MKKAIIILLIVFAAFQLFKYVKKNVSLNSNNDDSFNQIILFTAENCHPCIDAEMFLDQNEIEYTIYNIDESEESLNKFKEYKTITDISGPLMLVEKVSGVTYGELVDITLPNGELRRGQVLEIDQHLRSAGHLLLGKTTNTRENKEGAYHDE